MVIDSIYDIPSKIIHVASGKQLADHFETLENHFSKFGSPVMMGGDRDASSKGIFGTMTSKNGDKFLLVVDPHYWGKKVEEKTLYERNWISWKRLDEFMESSFYNLCLPQVRKRS